MARYNNSTQLKQALHNETDDIQIPFGIIAVDPVDFVRVEELPAPTQPEIAIEAWNRFIWRRRVDMAFDRLEGIVRRPFLILRPIARRTVRAIRSPAQRHARASDGGGSDDGEGHPRRGDAPRPRIVGRAAR